MIELLLGILKWIGITIGGLAGLLLLLVLLLLLSKLKYNVRLEKGDVLRVDASARWLLSMLRVDFRVVGSKSQLRVRFLWRTIKRGTGKEQAGNPSGAADAAAKELASDAKRIVKKSAKKAAADAADTVLEQADQAEDKAKDKNTLKTEKTEDDANPEEKGIAGMWRRIQLAVSYPDKALILRHTKDLLARLIRAVRPKRFVLRGLVGFEDPSVTGQLIGGIAVFRAMSGWDVNIKASFDESALRLRGMVAGRLTLWSLLWPLVRCVLQKPIWRIVKPMLFKRKAKKKAKKKAAKRRR